MFAVHNTKMKKGWKIPVSIKIKWSTKSHIILRHLYITVHFIYQSIFDAMIQLIFNRKLEFNTWNKHTYFNKLYYLLPPPSSKKSVNKFKLAIWLNPNVENLRSPKAHRYHNNVYVVWGMDMFVWTAKLIFLEKFLNSKRSDA